MTPGAVRIEAEVPGTPEEVWAAIATGAGISSWFIPAEVEERRGGTITTHPAPGASERGTVVAWEPPARFVYTEQEVRPADGEAPIDRVAYEFRVEPRAGGGCVVRLIGSGVDDADREALEHGWRGYLDNLRHVLTRFRGLPSASILARGAVEGVRETAWAQLLDELGLADARPGERVAVDAQDTPPLAGVVERVTGDDLLLVLDAPAPGLGMAYVYSMGDETFVNVHAYLFGDEAAAVAARDDPAWRAWMAERFPEQRHLTVEVEVAGTPEEVWEQLATGPGMSAWFVPSEIEAREGGTMVQHHDAGPDGEMRATVTAWEPPRRFAFLDGEPWQPTPDAPARQIETEIAIEPQAQGTCLVRLVAGGFGTDAAWDGAVESVRGGWTRCLAILRLVRERFAGRPSASFILDRRAAGSPDAVWSALTQAVGVSGAAAGDRTPAGTVGVAGEQQLVLVTDDPPGLVTLIAHDAGGQTIIRLQGSAFGDDAEAGARRLGADWSARLPHSDEAPAEARASGS